MFKISSLLDSYHTLKFRQKFLLFSLIFSLIYLVSFYVYLYTSPAYKSHFIILRPDYSMQNKDVVFLGKVYKLNWTGSHNEVIYQLFQDNINRLRFKIDKKMQVRFDRNVVVLFSEAPSHSDISFIHDNLKAAHQEQAQALLLAGKNYLNQITNELIYVFIGDLALPPNEHMWLLKNRHLIPIYVLERYLYDKISLVSRTDIFKNLNYQTTFVQKSQTIPFQAKPNFVNTLIASLISGFASGLVCYFISIYLTLKTNIVS